MQATAALAAKTQAKMQQFETATAALGRVEPANLSTLTNRSQIGERRTVVTNFVAANKSLKEFLSKQDVVMEAELQTRNLPPAKREQFLTAFRTSRAPMLPRITAIRNCDDQMGQALLKILDIAEANWGNWKYDPETEITLFEDGAAADAYNEQAEVISKAAARQVQLQGEVIKLQQRAAEAREEPAR
jgi:hypothetical protein